VKPIAVVIPLGADGSSLSPLAGRAAPGGPEVAARLFAGACLGARSPRGGALLGAQLADLGGQVLELAGLLAAEVWAAFVLRSQVGWC
jgi:hypothetical protein